MEQILAFILGVVTVALPLAVIVMFKTRKEVNKLAEIIVIRGNEISNLHRDYYEELDRLNSTIQSEVNELVKIIDSKGDRTEARLDARINDLVAFTDLSHHAIEKLQYQTTELQVAVENYINKEK